jgi:hypothetical protein
MSEMRVDDGAGRERKIRVDYPSNSKKSKLTEVPPPEREPVDKVITNEVIRRKQGIFSRVGGGFIAEDGGTVVSYVLMEVLLPAAKNMISDAVSQGIERMLFGDARPRSAGSDRRGYTNYSRFSRDIPGSNAGPSGASVRSISRHQRATHDFNDIIIASRAEAEDVLERLRDLINEYQVATVSDLYDLVGLTGEFTDDKWGWFDLRSGAIRAVRGGYMLQLPKTQPIV